MSYMLVWWWAMKKGQKELNEGIKARQEEKTEKRQNAVLANPVHRLETPPLKEGQGQRIKKKWASYCRSYTMTGGDRMIILTRGLTWGKGSQGRISLEADKSYRCSLGAQLGLLTRALPPGLRAWRTLQKDGLGYDCFWLEPSPTAVHLRLLHLQLHERHTWVCLLSRVWFEWPDCDAQQGKC